MAELVDLEDPLEHQNLPLVLVGFEGTDELVDMIQGTFLEENRGCMSLLSSLIGGHIRGWTERCGIPLSCHRLGIPPSVYQKFGIHHLSGQSGILHWSGLLERRTL